jgi:hypothetical protein
MDIQTKWTKYTSNSNLLQPSKLFRPATCSSPPAAECRSSPESGMQRRAKEQCSPPCMCASMKVDSSRSVVSHSATAAWSGYCVAHRQPSIYDTYSLNRVAVKARKDRCNQTVANKLVGPDSGSVCPCCCRHPALPRLLLHCQCRCMQVTLTTAASLSPAH